MNTHAPIDPKAQMIKLSQLYLHPMNPRQNGSAEDTAAMAASIAINGLIQNLAGYADPDKPGMIGIVAGGRRLRALQHLAEHGTGTIDAPGANLTVIPVRVTDEPMIARAWAGAEAATQKPLHPADEIRAYAAMAEQGNSPDMIARAFAQTEAHVRRRLALAELRPEVLEALRAGHITLDVAKALTLAKDVDAQLSVLTVARAGKWDASRVRRELTPDTVRGDDRRVRFITTALYTAEGGEMQSDLFEDCSYLLDAALVDRLFERELVARAEALREDQGWSWVKTTSDYWISSQLTDPLQRIYADRPELPEGDAARLEQLQDFDKAMTPAEKEELRALEARAEAAFTDEQRETGGIIVLVNHQGELETYGAYRVKEKATKGSAEDGSAGTSSAGKPDLTQGGTDDLHRIELLALQTALLEKPELVLDLLAWQIERGAPTYSSPFAIKLEDQKVTPDASGSAIIDPRLSEETGPVTMPDRDENSVEAFEAFRTKGKKHRNAVITVALTRTLQRPWANPSLPQLLAELTGADIRKVWTPDGPTYFSRLRTGKLDAIWAELAQMDPDAPERDDFGKLKKGEKVKELDRLFTDASAREALGLSRDACAKIDAWLPEELRQDATS